MTKKVKQAFKIAKYAISIGIVIYQSTQQILRLKNKISQVKQKNVAKAATDK